MHFNDTATFNTRAHAETVESMRLRREGVHDKGARIYAETGELDPNVNIFGKFRLSHNSFTPADGGQALLKNGIALPTFSGFDGTGSMGENAGKAFNAIPVIDTMLNPLRTRYHIQIASGVWQDVVDRHPVIQMSQFESDNRIAEQIRSLVPDHNGGDPTEDYDLGLAYLLLATDTDIFNFYGLKGYSFIVADQIGRGNVTPTGVKRYLGHTLQSTTTTRDLCRQLLRKWHLFYIQVASEGYVPHSETTSWWTDKLGSGRVVIVPNPDLLAEVQAGLMYVTETQAPTMDGFVRFITIEGANKRLDSGDAKEIWSWLQTAKMHFGAQAKLPGYSDIPMPGNLFAHFRHAWPIGHSRAGENVTPEGNPELPPSSGKKPGKSGAGLDWSRF